MHKFLMILFLCLPFLGVSQERLNFSQADSLSYQYYLKGDWNKLIKLSTVAFKQDIVSKFMHQRAGYAYFVTGDFKAAELQFAKALEFDKADEFTQQYLYYSALNYGGENTRLYAGQLSAESAKKMGIHRINPVDLIDTEFNLKTNQTQSRSNQSYYRIGISSDLGYNFSLYQSISNYKQIINSITTRQPEYFALLKWTPTSIWQFKAAFHHLFTNVGAVSYPGNLGLIAVSTHWKRFDFEANTSILTSSLAKVQQSGVQASVMMPGKSNVCLTGSLVAMYENASLRPIYSQTAGLRLTKSLWAEGNITLGNLKNYNTYNSLYVYNSADPSVFRTGMSLIYFAGKHLTIIANFTFDQQKIESVITNNLYYQYSYSGGLKWRL